METQRPELSFSAGPLVPVMLGHAGGMSWDELLIFVGFGLAAIWLIRRTERRSRERYEEQTSDADAGTDEPD